MLNTLLLLVFLINEIIKKRIVFLISFLTTLIAHPL